MEFSILIPVYNTSVHALASELVKQAEAITPNYQILFIDDCSDLSCSYLNQKVKQLNQVEYLVLSENIGRSAIRNKLFQEAKYDLCMVLDGDVTILKNDFIKTNLGVLTSNNIIVGGHVYQKEKPKDPAKYLHWYYGSKIESKARAERLTKPYASFMTANFACSKDTFSKIQFNEDIAGYGHEDTLFGIRAERIGIEILHIANPVRHDGLDSVDIFLDKQRNAIQNLKQLYQKEELHDSLLKHAKLIKFARITLFSQVLSLFRQVIYKNLRGNNPNLILLQMQKIIWWGQKVSK
jgi:glycosyltransferase involved in cell wall biosynthesis